MSPAEGRRQRAALMRQIARDLKGKNRAKLVALRAQVRRLSGEAKNVRAAAIAQCRRGRRQLPSQAELAAALRAAKRAARSQCDADLKTARGVKDAAARARAELAAEKKYQADLRRIESGNRAKLAREKKSRGPGVSRAPRQETDAEVEGNIPPELVALWRRVRRSIKGSDRKSRTEAFLEYAEEHPDEEWTALEDSVDRAIAEMERRQAMPNPKKKKKKGRRNPPRLTRAQSRKRFADLKKAGCKPKRMRLGGESVVVRRRACKPPPMPNPRKKAPPGSVKQGDLFMAPSGQLVLVEPSHEQRVRTGKSSAASRTREMFKKNPRKKSKKRKSARPKRADELTRIAARLAYGRKHRGDRATVSASYWTTPRSIRAAKLRSLARGNARQKRAAAALAVAELAHEGPPRKKNGAGMTDAQAAREYTRSHWGDRGRRGIVRTGAPNPAHGTASKLGRLHSVTYETVKKGDGEPTLYEHEFEGKRPTLIYNDGGLLIAGGDYVISAHGIEG